MKRFFSKLVSMVSAAAIAVSAVSMSAFAATPFSDVEEGSKYTQAFNELYALDILIGYEDGTVMPDNLITRAEVTKLVVAMMGPTYTQQAESKAYTDFTDVPYDEWYSGYVNVGVANGFISGNGDGTFAPNANVTYEEIVKMIVAAMGYGPICEKRGGWPNGYMSVAAEIGVTDGVSNNNTEPVTRAQVAQLIANGIKLPIVSVTGYSESAMTGQLIAQTQVMDDINGWDASDYQTLLSKNHEVYSVKGRVEATRRSDTGLRNGEIRFSVENTKNFDGKAYGSGYSGAETFKMYYNGANAQELMFMYADALVRKDDNDEYTIISLTPYAKEDSVTYDASLYDAIDKSGSIVTAMDIYTSKDSSKTKTYKMKSSGAKLFVNGVEVGVLNEDNVQDFIENNDNGKITFIDQTEAGKTTTDGKIDVVVVTYYDDAIVDNVLTQSDKYKIYFKNNSSNIRTGNMSIDPEDEDISVRYTMAGTEIAYTDIEEDDVLSIAYDVTGNFADSEFYDVYVSRSVVSGRVMSRNVNSNNDVYYTVGSGDYLLSYSIFGASADVLEVGTHYDLHLNNFGKIVYFDEDSSSKVIGVVDYASIGSDDTPRIRIITTAGTKVSYAVKNSSKELYRSIASKFFNTVNTGSSTACTGKKDLQYRMAEYTVNSYGYLTNATPLYSESQTVPTATMAEYRENVNKLGSYSLSESTIVIDVTENADLNDISKISVGNPNQLTDGATYSAFLYDKSNSDGKYRYMLLFGGSSKYTGSTNIAVYSKSGTVYDELQGTSVRTILAYSEGKAEPITIKVDQYCGYYMQTLKSSTSYVGDGGVSISEADYNKLNEAGFYSDANGNVISISDYNLLNDLSHYVDEEEQSISAEDYELLPETSGYVSVENELKLDEVKYYKLNDYTEITEIQYNELPVKSYYKSGTVEIAPAEYELLDNFGYYMNSQGNIIPVSEYEKLGAGETKYVSKVGSTEISEAEYIGLQDKSDYVNAAGNSINLEDYAMLPQQGGYKGSEGIITAEAYGALPVVTAYQSDDGKTISVDAYTALPTKSGYVNAESKWISEEVYNSLADVSVYENESGKAITEAVYNALPAVSGYVDSKGNAITETKYNALPTKSGYYDLKGNSITDDYYNKLSANSYYQRSMGVTSVTTATSVALGSNTAEKITAAQYASLPSKSCYMNANGESISVTAYDKLDEVAKAAYKYVEGKDVYTLVPGKDAYSYVAGKDSYSYREGKDMYRYVAGKSEYNAIVGRDAYTKVEGQDAYTYVTGQNEYKYRAGKDAYKVVEIAGQKADYKYVSGKADYSYVEGQDNYIVETSKAELMQVYQKGKDAYTYVAGKNAYTYSYGKADYTPLTSTPKRGSFNSATDVDQIQVSGLSAGDVFVYDIDGDGYATEIMVLFNSIRNNYSEFESIALNTQYYDFDSNNKLYSSLVHPVAEWLETTDATRTGKVDMIFGPVINKIGRSVSIGIMEDYGTYIGCDEDKAQDYSILDNSNIYVYDYSTSKVSERISLGNAGSVIKTNVPSMYKNTAASGENTIVDLESLDSINFIVAKVVDDDITEALFIMGSN